MAVKIYLFEVSHPEYGKVVVESIGPDSATMSACKKWDCEDIWGQVAGYCSVRRLGPAEKPRCRRCGKEYGRPGDVKGLCPACAGMEERRRRERSRIRERDRRAGKRER